MMDNLLILLQILFWFFGICLLIAIPLSIKSFLELRKAEQWYDDLFEDKWK
jgi:hypothetical protein